jgi:hypothetical protein
VRVEHVERLDRSPVEPELAVIVVLDDRGTGAPRPGEQRESSVQRHRHAERELVRGRDVDEPRLRRNAVDDDPFIVYRYAADPQA